MKLQQLRSLVAIVECQLNISAAAERLHTSQPGVSRQIRILEEELGITLFTRRGTGEVRLTEDGEAIFRHAIAIHREVENIERYAQDVKNQDQGLLTLATTQTQARYVLPPSISQFHRRYPNVALNMHQGTFEQLLQMTELGKVDFVIATGTYDLFPGLLKLPLYYWDRVLLVPEGHDLTRLHRTPTLKELAEYPLVTYVFSDYRESSLKRIFIDSGVKIDAAFTARDSDVIKTYVKLGLGVGIVAPMALINQEMDGLVALDASGLFPRLCTWVGFHKDTTLRKFMLFFLSCVAPHLDNATVQRSLELGDQAYIDAMFPESELPFVGHKSLRNAAE